MNLGKLTDFAIGIVLTVVVMGNLDRLQIWVIKTQAQLLFESRTETWGNPYFFKDRKK